MYTAQAAPRTTPKQNNLVDQKNKKAESSRFAMRRCCTVFSFLTHRSDIE